ncbi:MAG TPA: flagellar FliJ family protein [Gryllotalpicola sp.]
MTGRFRLDSLLRLRSAERDAAAAELSRVSERVRDGEALVARTRAALERLTPAAADVHELRAIAAARLANANMLDELRERGASARSELDAASAAFTTAGVRLRTLDRLAERSAADAREQELRQEQAALDEIAQNRRGEVA